MIDLKSPEWQAVIEEGGKCFEIRQPDYWMPQEDYVLVREVMHDVQGGLSNEVSTPEEALAVIRKHRDNHNQIFHT